MKIKKNGVGGSGWGGGGVRVDLSEELKFLCKFKKKNGWGEGVIGGRVGSGADRVDVNGKVKFFVKTQKYFFFFLGGGGVGLGGG